MKRVFSLNLKRKWLKVNKKYQSISNQTNFYIILKNNVQILKLNFIYYFTKIFTGKTAFNPIIFVGFQIKLVSFENQTLFNTTVKGIN